MSNLTESEKQTINLAIYQRIIKSLVLTEVKGRPPFHLYNLQYMFMEGFSIFEAVFEIITDVNNLTDEDDFLALCERLERSTDLLKEHAEAIYS